MKITYDKKIDAMYIYLMSKKVNITETKELGPHWIADYSGKDLVGIEILNASKVFGTKLGLKSKAKNSIGIAIPHKISK